MNITVTLTATPELLDALQGIVKAFTPAPNGTGGSVVEMKSKGSVKKAETPTPEKKSDAIVSTTDEAQVIPIEKLRATTMEKASAGKRDAVKALLSEFGVGRVTDLPKEKYSEFLGKVEAL